MASITGKAGTVTLGGAAPNGKVTNWSFTGESRTIEDTGMGDTTVGRIHLFDDWTAEFTFAAADQAAWDQGLVLVGTAAVFAFKRKSTDTNPYVTGTGLVESVRTTVPHDGRVETTCTVRANGTAVTIDTTPAT